METISQRKTYGDRNYYRELVLTSLQTSTFQACYHIHHATFLFRALGTNYILILDNISTQQGPLISLKSIFKHLKLKMASLRAFQLMVTNGVRK